MSLIKRAASLAFGDEDFQAAKCIAGSVREEQFLQLFRSLMGILVAGLSDGELLEVQELSFSGYVHGKTAIESLDVFFQEARLFLHCPQKLVWKYFGKFSSVPAGIGLLVSLVRMDLSANMLSDTLPPEFARLENLVDLDLSENKFTSLPIHHLPRQIQTLILVSNEIEQIPSEIREFGELRLLDMSNNKIKRFPTEIGFLTKLTMLIAQHNSLSFLPEEIGDLENLVLLGLCHNELVTLPSTVGRLVCLESLDLETNQLTSLPRELTSLANLTALDLRKNERLAMPPFKEFPKLRRLWLDSGVCEDLDLPGVLISREGVGS